jgi:hypothetical protein
MVTEEVDMVFADGSFQPLPGKEAEAVALTKEFAAYYDRHWPAPMPRQVAVEMTGETGRIHVWAGWETLADHERSDAEQAADAHVQALMQRFGPLMVPGSLRINFLRSA